MTSSSPCTWRIAPTARGVSNRASHHQDFSPLLPCQAREGAAAKRSPSRAPAAEEPGALEEASSRTASFPPHPVARAAASNPQESSSTSSTSKDVTSGSLSRKDVLRVAKKVRSTHLRRCNSLYNLMSDSV